MLLRLFERRTTSAAPARAASRRRRKTSSRQACWPSSARSRSRCRSSLGAELAAGQCPAPVREQLYKILFKPDKNAPEYKAVVEAAKQAQRAPLDLLKGRRRHRQPLPVPLAALPVRQLSQGHRLPGAGSAADQGRAAAGRRCRPSRSTTRHHRDRRCAVRAGPGQRHRGVRHPHRRAGPGHPPGSPIDKVARGRLSTVYMPGTRSPCCPTTWCRPTRCRKGATARP
jgi:exoribonuclease-2